MGITFGCRACTSLPQYSGRFSMHEIIAKRIVAAAKIARNSIRLRRSALKPFRIEPYMPMPRAGVGRGARIPAYLDRVLS